MPSCLSHTNWGVLLGWAAHLHHCTPGASIFSDVKSTSASIFSVWASHSVQQLSTVSIALLHLSLLYCCSRQGMRCVPQFAVGREACDIVRKSCTRHVGHASSIIAFSRFYLFCCALPSALILCLAGCCISHAGCVLFATRH